MKTHSSNVITKESSEHTIENFKLVELSQEKTRSQEIMDSLYQKKKVLEKKQDLKGLGFKIDEKIKDNLPTAKEEIELFERRVKEEVEKRIALIEQRAYEDGFSKARDSAYKAGKEQVIKEVEPFAEEIKGHLQNFRKIREELLIKNERILVDIIIMCVEKIIMGSYRKNDEILKSMLRGIIKMTGEREDIEIRLNPYDSQRINEFTKSLVDELGLKNGLRLESDKTIEKGGCKVITNLGIIDATLDKQFELLKQELGSRVPKACTNFVEEATLQKPEKDFAEKENSHLNSIKKPTENVDSKDIAKTIKERLKKDE